MHNSSDILNTTAHITDVNERADAILDAAWEIRRSSPRDALELSMEARSLAVVHNYQAAIGRSYLNTGTSYYLMSQFHHALIDLEKAQSFLETAGDSGGMATALRYIGNVYHSMGLYEPSIACYKKALGLTQLENDSQATAYNLANIGYVYHKIGNFDMAKTFFLESSILLEQINDELGSSDLMNNLGNVYLDEGNTAQGMLLIRESLRIAEKIKHIRGMATARKSLGSGLLKATDYLQALEELQAALRLAEELDELVLVTDILKQISTCYENLGEFSEALKFHQVFEKRKSELQAMSQQVLLDSFRIKSEAEKSLVEKEQYKKENAELDRIRREMELKNKELERLSIVASETENTILILDADGTIEWVNPSFEKLNGCSLPEFKRRYGSTIYEVSNNPGIRDIVSRCIDTRSSMHYESENVLGDGRIVWESSTMTPIFNAEGALSRIIIIDADATERKLNEEIIRQKNKDITDSINYARHLQEALLPPQESITGIFPQSFIISIPKDIVSGDFYWFSITPEVGLLAAADCTGHGVPGAFMSVIGNELLNIALHDPLVQKPSSALDMLDKKISNVFRKGRQEARTQDGMDIGLLVWHFKNNLIQFSGAKRPLVLIRDRKVQEFAGDRFSIGGKEEDKMKCFTDKTFEAKSGDMFYLFSDGFTDQFGGPHGKKFMYKKFLQLLISISTLNAARQKEELEKAFYAYKGDLEQVDDVLVIGIRIP
jgi:PAS domain S-box-containing protein